MKDPDSPSVRERRLARELREARIGAQLAGTAVASATGWSTRRSRGSKPAGSGSVQPISIDSSSCTAFPRSRRSTSDG
jgi:hypothetical protein